MLEFYLLDVRESKGFLPNLKTINKVPIELKGLEERTLEKKILKLMKGIWKLTNSYRLVKPGRMDEEPTFYINDEVGSSICHSDTPNTKMSPLIYSPNCDSEDAQTMTYSVVWAVNDIKYNEYFYRDFLYGIDETKWRSSRLLPWFNVFEEYFLGEWEKFKNTPPSVDALALHKDYQENYPSPSVIDWDVAHQGPIPVYTDYERVAEFLKDPRFKIVDNQKDAKILWLAWDYESKGFKEWGIDEANTYVNFFKKEGALVIKSHIANMINTTLRDTSCI